MSVIEELEDLQKQFEEFECKAREKEEPKVAIHTFKLAYSHLLDSLKDCQNNLQRNFKPYQRWNLYKRFYEGEIKAYNDLIRSEIKELQEKIKADH